MSMKERESLCLCELYSLERDNMCVSQTIAGLALMSERSVSFKLRLPSWRTHFYCTIEAQFPLQKITRSCTKRQTERMRVNERDRVKERKRARKGARKQGSLAATSLLWQETDDQCQQLLQHRCPLLKYQGGCECGCE